MLLLSGCALNCAAAAAAAAACCIEGCWCEQRTRALLSDLRLKGLGSVTVGLSTLGTPSCPELLSTRVLQNRNTMQHRNQRQSAHTKECLANMQELSTA